MAHREASQHPGVLLVVCSALFFGVVNGSAVAVVLPEIGADLDIPDSHLAWVLGGFLLAYGVAIPLYGRLASRFGARRLFLIGIATFSVGSSLSALAGSFEALLAARTVQALGGAAVPGLGMTLASRAFPEERRGLVLGVVSATMGLAAAVGPCCSRPRGVKSDGSTVSHSPEELCRSWRSRRSAHTNALPRPPSSRSRSPPIADT